MARTLHTATNQVIELSFQTGKVYKDPFNEIEVDLVVTTPQGQSLRVPAYWAGENDWRARFSTSKPGAYSYQPVSSDEMDRHIVEQHGKIEVTPYTGKHSLTVHGGLRVRSDRRGLEHLDGTPFFWLGDTWWMAFCGRIGFPEEFNQLIANRVSKGFSLVHMVAGLFPDMQPFDPRGANPGGFAWETGFERINPVFFDHADLKLQAVVRAGLVPLIVGAWGYYLSYMGLQKTKQHWRYLVARWGAYPVTWCLAGEVTMPFYLSETKDQDAKAQKSGWTEVGRYLRSIDPYQRTLTAHNGGSGESPTELDDLTLLDYNFVQTGHGNQSESLNSAIRFIKVMAKTSLKPVINSESHYEGILGTAWEDVQRFIFWTTYLSGGAGFSYGANGIWQLNEEGKPYGPSPHGMSWGSIPWTQAMHFRGSTQVSLGASLLKRYRYWEFDSHPEWICPHASTENSYQPYAAGIPGEVRIFYFPYPLAPWLPETPTVQGLEIGLKYRATFFDPSNGVGQAVGEVSGDASGRWTIPAPSTGQDMVLVLEKL
jgi:hypothetical protein